MLATLHRGTYCRAGQMYCMLNEYGHRVRQLPLFLFEKVPFQEQFLRRHQAIGTFTKHGDNVIARVARKQLLLFSVTEGYGPLCAFLGVEHPNVVFPRESTRSAVTAQLSKMQWYVYGALVVAFVASVIIWEFLGPYLEG